MNLLVTGGGGFLGAWIVKRLSGAGHRIRILEASANRQLLNDIAGRANAGEVDWRVETSSRARTSIARRPAATRSFTSPGS